MSDVKMTLKQILSTSSVILQKLVGELVISSFKSQHESCRLTLWMLMFINVYCSIWVPKYPLQIITTSNKIIRKRHIISHSLRTLYSIITLIIYLRTVVSMLQCSTTLFQSKTAKIRIKVFKLMLSTILSKLERSRLLLNNLRVRKQILGSLGPI